MSNNFYLCVPKPEKRLVHELYRKKANSVNKVLDDHNLRFSSEEAKENFLQEVLDALGIDEPRVVSVSPCRYEHLGKASRGKFTLAVPLSTIESYDPNISVEDEYGELMTMEEFRQNFLSGSEEIITTLIGTEFD